MIRDYRSGDAPVPVGVLVEYHDAQYEVVEHQWPLSTVPYPEINYPDGVAYVLWPVGVQKKFGNRSQSRVQVRRTSFSLHRQGRPPGVASHRRQG